MSRVAICEVGTRDGLQAEERFVATADKIALVDALSDAGLAKIEVTSFVSPKAIPQLRDAEIVLREIRRVPGVVYTCLVPNVRGAERAIESKADELSARLTAPLAAKARGGSHGARAEGATARTAAGRVAAAVKSRPWPGGAEVSAAGRSTLSRCLSSCFGNPTASCAATSAT